jgi:hypothetical protein
VDWVYQVLNEVIFSHFCQQPAHLQHALALPLGVVGQLTTPTSSSMTWRRVGQQSDLFHEGSGEGQSLLYLLA